MSKPRATTEPDNAVSNNNTSNTQDKGAAPPVGDVVPKAARISTKMREVLEIMATEGKSLQQAAADVGMHRQSAYRAWRQPHIKRAYNQMVREIRDNAAHQAYNRINHIAQTADSKRLQFDASRWVAGVDGISPVQKVEGSHRHNVQFGGFDIPRPGDQEPIDVTPDDADCD